MPPRNPRACHEQQNFKGAVERAPMSVCSERCRSEVFCSWRHLFYENVLLVERASFGKKRAVIRPSLACHHRCFQTIIWTQLRTCCAELCLQIWSTIFCMPNNLPPCGEAECTGNRSVESLYSGGSRVRTRAFLPSARAVTSLSSSIWDSR